MRKIIFGLLFLASFLPAMNKDVQKFSDRGHYNFSAKKRQVRFVDDNYKKIEKNDISSDCELSSSLVHEQRNNLIIARAALLLKGSETITVTVKKRTDVDWTNVYSVEHSIVRKGDYFIAFILESYLKNKIKEFENSSV